MMTATKTSNMIEIRQIGLKALLEALGPIGMTRFMQQYDTGYGDYTKEKYGKVRSVGYDCGRNR